jgi:hypothetical protein
MCCDPMGLGPGAARLALSFNRDASSYKHVIRVSSGGRRHDTHIYACGAYPFGLLGPVAILWQPGPDAGTRSPGENHITSKTKRKHAKRAATNNAQAERLDVARTVWIWSHPAMFEQVQDALQTATAKVLAEVDHQTGPSSSMKPVETIEIRDLKGEINAFDLTGPKSTAILQGVLNPVKDDSTNSREKIDVSQVARAGICAYLHRCSDMESNSRDTFHWISTSRHGPGIDRARPKVKVTMLT